MNIIKLDYSTEIWRDEEDINYIGNRLDGKTLLEIWRKYGPEKRWDKILPAELINDIIEEFTIDYGNIPPVEVFSGGHDEEIYDFLYYRLEDQDLLKYIIDDEKYNFDTVGYSPWSYVIYDKYYKWGYVHDLWEGWNFYDITLLDEEGKWTESISSCYMVNLEKKEIDAYVKDYFDIEDYYIVESDVTKWIKDIKKVKEVHDVRYIPFIQDKQF